MRRRIELGERPKDETVTYTVLHPGNDPEWRAAHIGRKEEVVGAG